MSRKRELEGRRIFWVAVNTIMPRGYITSRIASTHLKHLLLIFGTPSEKSSVL
jgi:hypothetical protein